MAVLKTAYPSYYKGENDVGQAANLWAELFADDDALVVAAAVKAFIVNDEKEFPPAIGQIKAMVLDLTSEKELTEMEAWGLVERALHNAYYNTQAEFDKLPTVVQRLVGSPSTLREWSIINTDTVQSVIASNFQRSYRTRVKSEREFMALPQTSKDILAELAGKMDMRNALDDESKSRAVLQPTENGVIS